MNIFFVILFVLMLSLVQTNAYDSYRSEPIEGWRTGPDDLVTYDHSLLGPQTIERYLYDDYSWTDPGFRSCIYHGKSFLGIEEKYTIECRYGSYDGQNVVYAYISESHANQLERNIEISANLGLVMYIFVFGSWALLLFTKINYKQTLFNLIASGAVI